MTCKKYMLISTALLISGCTTPPPPTPSTPVMKRQVSQIETSGIHIIQHGDRLTMIIPTDVYFEPMTTTIRPNERDNLRRAAQFTKNFVARYPGAAVRVTGYTDRVFSQYTQWTLSQQYAESVASYLFNAGIDSSQLAVQGRGSSEPVAGEASPSSMALNRRVVIQIN